MKEIAIITEANTSLTLEPELAEAVRNVIGSRRERKHAPRL